MAAVRNSARFSGSPWLGGLCVLLVTLLCSLALQSLLQSSAVATQFVSQGLWRDMVGFLDAGTIRQSSPAGFSADPSYLKIAAINLGSSLVFWTLGGWLISRRTGQEFSQSLHTWGVRGWLWGTIPAVWEIARIASAGFGPGSAVEMFLQATSPLWMAAALAGWLATFAALIQKPSATDAIAFESKSRSPAFWGVVIAAGLYVIVFTAMNWQLYRNLLVPHGDSAMYEEHLWNFTHGKGFRSYLEDRLFLGEHLQVVHLLLLPLHWIWPSLMVMDLAESLALALGALPVFWITARHTNSPQAGLFVAAGYLLYFPMQYLDIAIDLKTFRPTAFGIPAILYGLDQMERGRLKSAVLFWLIALSAQEDFTIVLAPLGLWMAIFPSAAVHPQMNDKRPGTTNNRWLGFGMAVFCTLYLFVALKYVIPWFRSGAEIHYVGYFQQFGSSMDEVVRNILGNPRLLFSELFAVSTPIYAMSLLVPLGMMALFSPSRLLVGLPLFALLCLNQIARTPQHHFHAPLVPILFWAAAVGVARFPRIAKRVTLAKPEEARSHTRLQWPALFVLTSAVSTGLFASIGPLGVGFWDPHSTANWKGRYLISERAKMFERIVDDIPKSARVFSTDFVHPRFTHHARSYDYSGYPRKTDEEFTNPVPGVTYYLVIDTQHPYSTIKTPEDIPEYRENPEDWELLPDETDGYFIVLKRRSENTPAGP